MSLFGKHDDDGPYAPPASWSVRCPSDPRFDADGTAYGTWDAMFRAEAHIKACVAKYGVSPADVEMSGVKS